MLRVSFLKICLSFIAISIVLTSYNMLLASGEQSEPKAVLLRLEDVGPGGEYSDFEQLGKLRAVLEFLGEQGVSFQIGVIPKWVNYSAEGRIYNRSLDQTGDLYVDAFNRLLKQASEAGAVIGMHGYTHQVGETKRADGHQESAIGNEFRVDGLPETSTPAFAEERLAEGLKIFSEAGLKPWFWETPHYHGALEQYPVFASHFGIIYENEPAMPSQTSLQLRMDANAGGGAATRGAAYVPTPFSYIPYNKDERLILDQLGKSDRLPSFFYHAFLEFKHLQPVTDDAGNPVYRDGLPDYKYPDKSKTNLQKLIAAIKERGYRFYSLHDFVPFTPWSQVPAASAGKGMKLADADGDGQLDAVTWNEADGTVRVKPGAYRGSRSDVQPEAGQWAVIPRQKGDLFSLKDENGDGKADLWIVRASGKLELYRSGNSAFRFARSWKLPSLSASEEAYVLRSRDGSFTLALLSNDGTELVPYYFRKDAWKRGKENRGRAAVYRSMQELRDPSTGADQLAYCRKSASICTRLELLPGDTGWTAERQTLNLPVIGDKQLIGDYNGDGLDDILTWEESGRRVTVYRQTEDGGYDKLSSFGPWGLSGAKPVVADLDGNGKTDLAALEPDGTVDTALSFQTGN